MQQSPIAVLTRDSNLLTWCVVASIAMHALMISLLPGWRVAQENLPKPLTVEIIKPPEIEPPTPLPLTPEPPPRIKPKPEPVKETKRTEPAPQPKAAPILTAPPDAQTAPQAPVVPPQPPVQDSKPRSEEHTSELQSL